MTNATIGKPTLDVARSIPKRNERTTFDKMQAKRIISAPDRSFVPNEPLRKAMNVAAKIEANSLKS